MKPRHVLVAAIGLLSAAAAVQAFYEHPTYGRGLQAFAAVVGFGRFL